MDGLSMKRRQRASEWLLRAKSNMARANEDDYLYALTLAEGLVKWAENRISESAKSAG